ncbi:MAG: FtsQ-type POTRA domain-containing protein [Candidatus Moranbacteria bacterium]|jgi:cell division septal protein FtsQ|nr:FtsQ-type POTRA domain-containing protein [Candidatus Moranbacteria bacterium]
MVIKEKKNHWAKKREKKEPIIRVKKFIRPTIVYNILLVFFVGVAIYSFVFANFLEINEISVDNQGTIDDVDIQKTISGELDGKYLWVISKNNFIFFNSKKIEVKLKNEFKKIKTVNVSKKFPDKVNVIIEERNLILALCSRGECYFIDENGYAYEKINPETKDENQNEIIELVDESGKEIRENEYVLLPSFVEFIVNVAAEIKDDANLEILNEYRTRSRISEEVIVQTKKGWDIYLNAKFPIDKSTQTLKTLLNRHLMLKDLNELEYIDLRSENKVFYRMIGGVTQEEEAIKKESEAAGTLEGGDVEAVKDDEKKDEKKEE